MIKDLSELVGYLDQKFQETAKKEDLLKLARREEFDVPKREIREDLRDLKEKVQALTASVDRLVQAVNNIKTR
ncbi:MAG: hypothetical protein Q8N65_02105 [bacterium]|nr:hypothetical protein [bacterium]